MIIKNSNMVIKNKDGFTLLELILVVSIIGMLMVIFYPKLSDREKLARVQSVINISAQIFDAAEKWRLIEEKMNYEGITIEKLNNYNLWDNKVKHAFTEELHNDTYSISPINNNRGIAITIKYIPIEDKEIKEMFTEALKLRNYQLDVNNSTGNKVVILINN